MKIKTAICASYHENFEGIMALRKELVAHNVDVLFPLETVPKDATEEFVLLDTDQTSDPKRLQEKNLSYIELCDFLVIYNPTGRIGASVSMELGYALKSNVPVISTHEVDDITLAQFISLRRDIIDYIESDEFFASRTAGQNTNARGHYLRLDKIQSYAKAFVVDAGFDQETPAEVLLLLQEEIGELARAIGTLTGLKKNKDPQRTMENLGHELADCLQYLAIIANKFDVRLSEVFEEKRAIDDRRFLLSQR